jgi:hypothetical protein
MHRQKRPPSYEALWKRQVELMRLAKEKQRQTELMRPAKEKQNSAGVIQQLLTMTLPDLIREASRKDNGLVAHEARKVFFQRTGRKWIDFRKEQIAQIKVPKKEKVTISRAGLEKRSIPEIFKLLRSPHVKFTNVSQVHEVLLSKMNLTKIKGKKSRRQARRPTTVARSRPGHSDYLKPWSKEFDMPEYDLE